MSIPASRLIAPAAIVVFAAALVTVPAARASAQAFLNLFRVVHVTAVPVNVDRLKELSDRGLDVATLIGSQVQARTDAGPAQVVNSPADAAQAAGLTLRLPTVMPPDLVLVRTEVKGAHSADLKADTSKLREILDALNIDDIEPPAGLDGQTASIRVAPIVRTVYANGSQEVSLFQARSPEITLPPGIDLPPIAEIALRVAGMGRTDAHTLAQAIDWRSTMIVPVPAGAARFNQVDVRGSRGMLVEGAGRRGPRAVLWSTGGVVYAMTGSVNGQTLLQIAQSVQ